MRFSFITRSRLFLIRHQDLYGHLSEKNRAKYDLDGETTWVDDSSDEDPCQSHHSIELGSSHEARA